MEKNSMSVFILQEHKLQIDSLFEFGFYQYENKTNWSQTSVQLG